MPVSILFMNTRRVRRASRMSFDKIKRQKRGDNKMQEKTKTHLMQHWTRIWLMIAAICLLLPVSSLIVRAQEARPEPTEPPILSRIRRTIRTCAGVGVPGVVVNIDGDFG